MGDAVGFAFIAGAALGFMAGIFFIAVNMGGVDKKRVKTGLMEHEGNVYGIYRITNPDSAPPHP